jgi:hypothetical protein
MAKPAYINHTLLLLLLLLLLYIISVSVRQQYLPELIINLKKHNYEVSI